MRIDRYGEGRVREGWRGRIRGSEAEASLLGDYGSLIPIQRSSTTREKKKLPQAISRRRERERKRKTRLNAFHSSARYVCTLYRVGCLFKIRDTKAQSRYTGARGVQSLRYRERGGGVEGARRETNFVVRLETVGGGFCYGEIVGNESNDAYDPFRFLVSPPPSVHLWL